MVKNITRSDITEAIYRKLGLPHTESAKFIDQVLDEIIAALKNGRNPKTGESYPITPRTVVGFKASNAFKKALK